MKPVTRKETVWTATQCWFPFTRVGAGTEFTILFSWRCNSTISLMQGNHYFPKHEDAGVLPRTLWSPPAKHEWTSDLFENCQVLYASWFVLLWLRHESGQHFCCWHTALFYQGLLEFLWHIWCVLNLIFSTGYFLRQRKCENTLREHNQPHGVSHVRQLLDSQNSVCQNNDEPRTRLFDLLRLHRRLPR